MFSYCLAEKGASHSLPSHATPATSDRSARVQQRKVFRKNAIRALCCRSPDIQRFCSLHHGTAGGGQRARVCVTTPILDMGDRSNSQLLSQSYAVSPCQDTGEVGLCRISRDIPRLTIENRTATSWLFHHRCVMRAGPLGGVLLST